MNAKISVLSFVLKRSYIICYCIICMTVLININSFASKITCNFAITQHPLLIYVTNEKKNFLVLELKKSLLITRDHPSLKEHFIGTAVVIRKALLIQSFPEILLALSNCYIHCVKSYRLNQTKSPYSGRIQENTDQK